MEVSSTAELPLEYSASLMPYADPTLIYLSADMDGALDLVVCADGQANSTPLLSFYSVDGLELMGCVWQHHGAVLLAASCAF